MVYPSTSGVLQSNAIVITLEADLYITNDDLSLIDSRYAAAENFADFLWPSRDSLLPRRSRGAPVRLKLLLAMRIKRFGPAITVRRAGRVVTMVVRPPLAPLVSPLSCLLRSLE